MATKVFTTLYEKREELGGEENYRAAFNMFLSGIIATFLAVGLKEQAEKPVAAKDLVKSAEQNFVALKQLLQNSVANGVQSGIMHWSGQQVEYYCMIKMTPDAVNTKPC